MKLPVRLLPCVVIAGLGLFVLKGTDLVHEAYALTGETAAPANPDYAGGDDDQGGSASEVDVLGSLAKRRKELDAREQQMNLQANMLAAAEQRVDAKIAQLKALQAQMASLLVQRDEAQKAQIAALVKTYSTMKPKDAARIFDTLPDDVLVPVAQQMKSDVMALVLANMTSDNAKALTVKLANRLALPQTADAMAPAPVMAPVATPAPSAAPADPAPKPRKSARARRPQAVASAAPATPAPAPATASPPQAAPPAPAPSAPTTPPPAQ